MRHVEKPTTTRFWIAVLAAWALTAPPLNAATVPAEPQGLALCAPTDGQQVSAPASGDPAADYVIGPGDTLSVHVFGVDELSVDKEIVDATGRIELPLIGTAVAAGKTSVQLQQEIAARLGEKYLQSPQVAVAVMDSASQKVTVEGDVMRPGVYVLRGRITLMEAIAMAGGPDAAADLKKVAVIRDDHGVRRAGVCDYESIRRGRQFDPAMQGDDIVVVAGSRLKQVWGQLLTATPVLGLIRQFGQ
jgi:polysaccharide export outer membrane protein